MWFGCDSAPVLLNEYGQFVGLFEIPKITCRFEIGDEIENVLS